MDSQQPSVDNPFLLDDAADVVPVKRARKTYGKKPQPENDEQSGQPTPAANHVDTGAPSMPALNFEGKYRKFNDGFDWRQKLGKMDCFDDEDDLEVSASLALDTTDSGRLSHPQVDMSALDRHQDSFVQNSSFASGTSGAISSGNSSPNISRDPHTPRSHPRSHSRRQSNNLPDISEDESSSGQPAKHTTPLRPMRNAGILAHSSLFSPVVPSRNVELSPQKRKSLFDPQRSLDAVSPGNLQLSPQKPSKSRKFISNDESDEDTRWSPRKATKPVTDSDEELGWVTDGDKENGSRAHKKSHIKKPTKKEILKTEQETARLRGERDIDVQDLATYKPLLFDSLMEKKRELLGRPFTSLPLPIPIFTPAGKRDLIHEDPITAFSSSPHLDFPTINFKPMPKLTSIRRDSNDALDALQESSTQVLEKNRKAQQLREKKMRLMESSLRQATIEDDSDLEFDDAPKSRVPAKGRSPKLTEGQRQLMALGVKSKGPKRNRATEGVSTVEYSRALFQKVKMQNAQAIKEKEDDFMSRGGILKVATEPRVSLATLLEKAASNDNWVTLGGGSDEEDDDPSYQPGDASSDRVTHSPKSERKETVLVANSSVYVDIDEPMNGHGHAQTDGHTDVPESSHDEQSEADEEDDIPLPSRTSRHAIIDSDEESLKESDAENIPPSGVVRSQPRPRLELNSLLDSPTPGQRPLLTPRTPLSEMPTARQRSVSWLGSTPVLSPDQHRLTASLGGVSQQVTPLLPAFDETLLNNSFTKGPAGFSQFFKDDVESEKEEIFPDPPADFDVQPWKIAAINTQLFLTQSSPSSRASPSKQARGSKTQSRDPLAHLRPKGSTFDFSQQSLLPEIELSTQQAKELERIERIDHEEALRDAELARRKALESTEDQEPRWINEAGLFTQTKPQEASWSWSQATIFPRPDELDAEALLMSQPVTESPVRRLRRRADMPENAYSPRKSPQSSPQKIGRMATVHEALMGSKAQHSKAKREIVAPEIVNRFVGAEAEESDEDRDILGFGSLRDNEAEEEANIDPKELEALVDDRNLSEKEIAEKLVQEKHKEHLEEDDAANQKVHEAAIAGQFRTKKRNHGMIDDSDSDDDTRARPVKYKKRKIEGGIDQLDDLEKNPSTAPFVEAYNSGLPGQDEENDFAYLQAPSDAAEFDDFADDEDTAMGGQSDFEEEMPGVRKALFVTQEEITRDVQQRIANGEDLTAHEELTDPDTFVQQHLPSSDWDPVDTFREVSHKFKGITSPVKHDIFQMKIRPKLQPSTDDSRLASWAKENGKNRDMITRGTASAAITGHSKANASRSRNVASGSAKPGAVASRPFVREKTLLGEKISKKTGWDP